MSKSGWTQGDKIALTSFCVVFVVILTKIATPDIKCFLGSKAYSCRAQNQPAPVTLQSAVGFDYSQLENLLKAGNFKAADIETRRVMLLISHRQQDEWIDLKSLEQFPCADLRTIDQLWIKYSDGKFGFSAQQRIWKEAKYNYVKFSDRVGWRVNNNWLEYDQLSFDLKSPTGQLPVATSKSTYGYIGAVRWDNVYLDNKGKWNIQLGKRDEYGENLKLEYDDGLNLMYFKTIECSIFNERLHR